MKMSLLEMVQDIMSDMSSDAVNYIDETEESLQVVQIIKSTYNEMMTRREWPHLQRLLTLSSYGSVNHPTLMIPPENLRRLEWINYNRRSAAAPQDNFQPVKYLAPNNFVQLTNTRNIANPGVLLVVLPSGTTIRVLNNVPPSYWTSFDDSLVVFDSFDRSIENTLQGPQSQCMAHVYPTWETIDTFVPDIPTHLFPALLAEAKSACFYTLKSQANEKAEQQSSRQQRVMSMQSWKLAGGITYPNYGRKQWRR